MQSLQCVQSIQAIQILEQSSLRAVISLFQIKKRQLINTAAGNSRHVLDHCGAHNQTSNKHDEKELLHCTSLGYRDIQCTRGHTLPVSLEPELDPVHTQQCCDYSLSQAAEQSGESHQVLTELHYDMEGKRRRIASFDDTGGPRAPLRSNFDDPEAFSEEECSQQEVVQHMVPVSGRPIIMCGTLGCSGSCSLSAVEYGYGAGKKPATCQICGRIFPCPNSRNVSPVTSRRSSVVSWSDSPRDQAVPKSEDAVMEDCTEPHQIWNDTTGEQSRNQVGTTAPAAMGPCAPSEPVLHSSGFVVTSEHAVCVETRVDCAVSHGIGKSGGKGTIQTSPAHLAWSQPFVGTQSAQVGHPGVDFAVEAVVPVFPSESSAVSHGVDVAMSGGSCGKGTSPAYLARSQPHAMRTCWLSRS